MSALKIVADKSILLLNDFFCDIGDVYTVVGRDLCFDDVQDADILLVRSVTKVNQQLLEKGAIKSTVKFVGSCTIGVDHLDSDYLAQEGILWANAPGCNSAAVVQYVLSAMAYLRPEWRNSELVLWALGVLGVCSITFYSACRLRYVFMILFLLDHHSLNLVEF